MPPQRVRNFRVMDASGDAGKFTGSLVDDLPHGRGEILYPDGRRYKGEFQLGRWHGEGLATFPNGDTYSGEYRLDQRHGDGEYRWKDGRIYKGQFFNDVRHGIGFYQWRDGAVYRGEFWEGARQGKGEYIFSGGRYKGDFRKGQYHGYGECTWEDGRVYKGEWMEGMAHGQGVVIDGIGRILHEGEWSHDEPVQDGTMPSDNSSTTSGPTKSQFENAIVGTLLPVVNEQLKDARGRPGTFRGTVLRGMPHGVGFMVYSDEVELFMTYQGFWDMGEWQEGRVEYKNGDYYHGDFMNDQRDGKGEYHWSDSRQYHGEWREDRRHGQGKFLYPNGDLFEGQFLEGARQGQGRFEFSDGSVFEGNFKKGQFHGKGCKYVHKDGRVYQGEFSDGLRNGTGKELYPNGQLRYEGPWVNDQPVHPDKIQPSPPGFVIQEDGDEEDRDEASSSNVLALTADCHTVVDQVLKDAQGNQGRFTGLVNTVDFPHGVGRMVYKGEIREGFWLNGFIEGHARAFFANGDYYEGNFSKSQREGKGVYKWKDNRIYEGEYFNDMRHGMGRFVYPSGDEYVGQYEKGLRCGRGKFRFADGSVYNGEWANSLYQGHGVLTEANGNYFEGTWKEGKRHGEGLLCNEATGMRRRGFWHEDEFVRDSAEEQLPVDRTHSRLPRATVTDSVQSNTRLENTDRPNDDGAATSTDPRWTNLEEDSDQPKKMEKLLGNAKDLQDYPTLLYNSDDDDDCLEPPNMATSRVIGGDLEGNLDPSRYETPLILNPEKV